MVRHEKGYDIEVQPDHLLCALCFANAQLPDGTTDIGMAIFAGGTAYQSTRKVGGTEFHGVTITATRSRVK
jgi:hypothetical protein